MARWPRCARCLRWRGSDAEKANTNTKDTKLSKLVREVFDLTPRGIIKTLHLMRPIYQKTAAYGHFGRPLKEFTWEATDKADILKRKARSL